MNYRSVRFAKRDCKNAKRSCGLENSTKTFVFSEDGDHKVEGDYFNVWSSEHLQMVRVRF